jgi:hypothetical protein
MSRMPEIPDCSLILIDAMSETASTKPAFADVLFKADRSAVRDVGSLVYKPNDPFLTGRALISVVCQTLECTWLRACS